MGGPELYQRGAAGYSQQVTADRLQATGYSQSVDVVYADAYGALNPGTRLILLLSL